MVGRCQALGTDEATGTAEAAGDAAGAHAAGADAAADETGADDGTAVALLEQAPPMPASRSTKTATRFIRALLTFAGIDGGAANETPRQHDRSLAA